jgi:Eukaryotic-type carbonic anhydrase
MSSWTWSLLLPAIVATCCCPALSNAQGWDDSFKLDYSYDTLASNGPASWGSVVGIGEWATYDTSSAQSIARAGNQCDTGNFPSPIVLEVPTTTSSTTGEEVETAQCPDRHEPLTRQIDPSVDCSRTDVVFDITPHSLKAYFPLPGTVSCLNPSLFLSGRPDPYGLLWMEVRARAEHVVGGRQYDAEIQMVHAGMGQEDGQLMIVSLLVEAAGSGGGEGATEDDLEFEWLLQQWNDVAVNEAADCQRRTAKGRRRGRNLRPGLSDYLEASERPRVGDGHPPSSNRNQTWTTVVGDKERRLQFTSSPCLTDRFGQGCEPLGPRRRMFPYNLWPSIWYYGYAGSLTAPPCTEAVQWRIMDEPLLISRRQYKILASLLSSSRDDKCELDTATSRTGENRRPIQETNSFFQAVHHCTPQNFGYFVYEPSLQ